MSPRWSRPRAARRRTGPFCPAPRAPGRPIRARRRARDGRSSHSHRIATPPPSSDRSRCSSAAPGGSPAARASRPTARAPILRARCRPASARGPGRRAARTRAAAGTRLPTARAARRRGRARLLKPVRWPAPPESVPGIARAVWTWASPRDPVGSRGRRATARPPRAAGSRAGLRDWSIRTRRSPAPRARSRVPRTPPPRTRAPAPCEPGSRAESPPDRRRSTVAPRCRTPSLRRRRPRGVQRAIARASDAMRSEEHTSELQSQSNLVCRLLLEKKKERIRPALVRLPDMGVERTSIADTVMREVLEVVHRTEAVEGSEGHRRAIFESPDDEGTGQGLVRRETCGEVFHARIEVYDVLLEFSEDQVAPEGIVFGREQIIDQD